jgi:hypothetical protein
MSRAGKNQAVELRCVITTDTRDLHVVVEGVARHIHELSYAGAPAAHWRVTAHRPRQQVISEAWPNPRAGRNP